MNADGSATASLRARSSTAASIPSRMSRCGPSSCSPPLSLGCCASSETSPSGPSAAGMMGEGACDSVRWLYKSFPMSCCLLCRLKRACRSTGSRLSKTNAGMSWRTMRVEERSPRESAASTKSEWLLLQSAGCWPRTLPGAVGAGTTACSESRHGNSAFEAPAALRAEGGFIFVPCASPQAYIPTSIDPRAIRRGGRGCLLLHVTD